LQQLGHGRTHGANLSLAWPKVKTSTPDLDFVTYRRERFGLVAGFYNRAIGTVVINTNSQCLHPANRRLS